MRAFVITLVFVLAGAASAAKGGAECIGDAGFAGPDFGLPQVARAIAKKKLNIAVVGTASSQLTGAAGTNIAYPTRLNAALTDLLPGVDVKVSTFARARATALDMQLKFGRLIAEANPALVVWQTGTVDAIAGVDPEEFRVALDDGVEVLQAAKVDMVFMNMQYSPRTDAVLAVGAYADAMRIVGLQRNVNLFDRLSIMKRWNEAGVFDLYGATRTTVIAERVHDCLGRLLADLIVAGAKLATATRKNVP